MLVDVVERGFAREHGHVAQLFLDADQLVVLAIRSVLDIEPVLIWPALNATAMSAMVVSSVSPERWETTAV